MESNNNPVTFTLIIQYLLKGIIFGILPFLVFVAISSRSAIVLGLRSFVILTGSMEPSLPTGSIVFTRSFSAYRIGDVIAFENGPTIATHRVIDTEVKNGIYWYKTQGDANSSPDSQLISQSKVLGKVFYHLPYLGKLAIFLKTPTGFLLMIVFPAIIFIIFEIINIKNELVREIEKKYTQKMQII